MASFGTIAIGDTVYLYRKPEATVTVFGERRTTGRDYFGAWKWDEDSCNLSICGNDETQTVYDAV